MEENHVARVTCSGNNKPHTNVWIVNMSVANDVDFLEFRFGGAIRQTCLFSRKFRRFFGRLLTQTFGTFVARFRNFIAQNCPLVGKSMNEEALKLTVFKFRFYCTVFGPPFIKWAQVFRS